MSGGRTYRILGTLAWVVFAVMLGMLALVTGFVFVIENA